MSVNPYLPDNICKNGDAIFNSQSVFGNPLNPVNSLNFTNI